MNIVVRNIYVFDFFCILDTFFDAPILYYAKGYNQLINITPLSGYISLHDICRKGDHYLFFLETESGEKAFYASIEAHSTPYLIAYLKDDLT